MLFPPKKDTSLTFKDPIPCFSVVLKKLRRPEGSLSRERQPRRLSPPTASAAQTQAYPRVSKALFERGVSELETPNPKPYTKTLKPMLAIRAIRLSGRGLLELKSLLRAGSMVSCELLSESGAQVL